VTIDEWIDVWGILVGKAKKMDDFPMWLQYYPKVLFDVINRSGEERFVNLTKFLIPLKLSCNNLNQHISQGTGIISKSELKYFYTAFMDVGKLGEQRLDEITSNAYKAMTSVMFYNNLKKHLLNYYI